MACAVVEVHYRSIHPRVALLRPPHSVVLTYYLSILILGYFENAASSFFLFFSFFFSVLCQKGTLVAEIDSDERETFLFLAREYIRSDDSSVSSVLNIKISF